MDKKTITILGIITIAIIGMIAIPVLSSEGNQKGKYNVEKERVEIEVEIKGSWIELEVEAKNFDDGEYRVMLECLESPTSNPILDGVLRVINGKGKLEMKDSIAVGEYKGCMLEIGDKSFSINDFKVSSREQEIKRKSEGLEIKAEMIDNISIVKVENEFVTDSKDRREIAELILSRLNLTSDEVANILKIEREDEIKISMEMMRTRITDINNINKVKFEFRFITDEIDPDKLSEIIASRLASITIDDIINSIEMRRFNKDDAKNVIANIKSRVSNDLLDPERLEKIIGGNRAVASIRLTLLAENDTNSFGSAEMLFIKGSNREIGRIVITVITDRDVNNLMACYNNASIGELDITNASNGFKVGKLNVFIDNFIVNIPGASIDIVEGDDCRSTPLLSGSI